MLSSSCLVGAYRGIHTLKGHGVTYGGHYTLRPFYRLPTLETFIHFGEATGSGDIVRDQNIIIIIVNCKRDGKFVGWLSSL